MGIFDIFKKKDWRKNPDFPKFVGTIQDILTLQVMLTPMGNKLKIPGTSPLGTLPDDMFVYGYLYGYINFCFYNSKWHNLKGDPWMAGMIIIFKNFYGEKGLKILANSSKLMDTNKEFMAAVNFGGKQAEDNFINRKNPVGLCAYLGDDKEILAKSGYKFKK